MEKEFQSNAMSDSSKLATMLTWGWPLKQFECSLQMCAFNWYMDLEPKPIDSWDQMKHEDNYFSQPTISIM